MSIHRKWLAVSTWKWSRQKKHLRYLTSVVFLVGMKSIYNVPYVCSSISVSSFPFLDYFSHFLKSQPFREYISVNLVTFITSKRQNLLFIVRPNNVWLLWPHGTYPYIFFSQRVFIHANFIQQLFLFLCKTIFWTSSHIRYALNGHATNRYTKFINRLRLNSFRLWTCKFRI